MMSVSYSLICMLRDRKKWRKMLQGERKQLCKKKRIDRGKTWANNLTIFITSRQKL